MRSLQNRFAHYRIVRSVLMLAVVCLSLVGCRQKNPVVEVSAESSGVVVQGPSDQSAAKTVPWSQWRGNQLSGKSDDQDQVLVTEWDDKTNIVWRVDVPGRGHGSPIVTENLVLLATALDDKQQQLIVAFSRQDGAELWRKTIHEGGFPSSGELHKKGTNANGTLACDGERIFAAFFNSNKVFLTALDLTGKELWQRELGAFSSKFGYAPSPILFGSLVIVAADNWGGGYLSAVDAATGEIAWRVARSDDSTYSTPTIANVGGKHQLLISGGGNIVSYDPVSGEEFWRTPCLAEATCGTVICWNDHVYASGGYPKKETVCLTAEGEKIWANNKKVYEPSLLAVNDRIFAVTDAGIAYCWEHDSGETVWQKRLGGSFSSSPVYHAGNIYVSDLSGKTYVFAASGDDFEQVAVNSLGSDCYASPAIADGSLYYRIGVQGSGGRQEQLVRIGLSTDEE